MAACKYIRIKNNVISVSVGVAYISHRVQSPFGIENLFQPTVNVEH